MSRPFLIPDDEAVKAAVRDVERAALGLDLLAESIGVALAFGDWEAAKAAHLDYLRSYRHHDVEMALRRIEQRARWETRPILKQRPPRPRRRSRAKPETSRRGRPPR